MIPFMLYRFDFPPGGAEPERVLEDSFQKHDLKHLMSESNIKVWSDLGFFRNSWNPIFVGRLENDGTQRYLVGHFRVHWYTIIFSIFFLGSLLYQLVTAVQQPEVRPGYIPGWRAREIKFTLEFIMAFFGITATGWLIGIPNARRVLAALRESVVVNAGQATRRPPNQAL